ERNHLDHARLGIGIIDPEPRLRGGAHACAFAVHGRILSTHAAIRSTVLSRSGTRSGIFAHPASTRNDVAKRERIAAMKVICTNGVKSIMLHLIPAFERTSGTKIVITWGSTNGLLKELEGGAVGDLAILTAEAIDDLIEHGKAVAGSRVDLARSAIGVAVRKGAKHPDIGSPGALKRRLIR